MIRSTVAKYALVGATTTLVGYATVLTLQYAAQLSPHAANAGGYLVGWVMSYMLNRRYTFNSQRAHREGLPMFALGAALCYAINAVVLQLAIATLELPGALAQALAMLSYSVSFYLLNRHVIFKHGR
jgi:putative flippase GtrA